MGYKQLQIYKRSYKAALAIYRITKEFPETERFALTNQMQRASTSIALNIAEGYAKKSSQEEFKRFLLMALGSANEMSVLIDFSKDLGYITEEQYEKASREYDEIGKMLNKFVQTVNRAQSKIQYLASSVQNGRRAFSAG